MIDSGFPKIHNEGYKFLVIFTIGTIILYFISGFLGFIGLVLTIWCYYFFRDPERVSVEDDNFLISPADGTVLQVLETKGPKELGLENKNFRTFSAAEVYSVYSGPMEAAANGRIKNLLVESSGIKHIKIFTPLHKYNCI